MRRFAANVDVDSLHLYHAIHGLDPGGATEAAWLLGVPRFLELFEDLAIRATFFVVASDLERAEPRRVAAEVVARGHELASHTFSHPYDLIHRSEAEIHDEIARAEAPLAELRGSPVRGFRAPGYNFSRNVSRVLDERGYAYDSSLLPSPPYYAARAAVIASMRVAGRRSRSIVGDLRAPFSRRTPHRLRGTGLVEFPVTVLPVLRVPLIGTTLTMLGGRGVRMLAPLLRGLRFANLEFHALDLLDADDIPGTPLAEHQPDLRVPVSTKLAVFADAIEEVARGAENDTLEGFAAR